MAALLATAVWYARRPPAATDLVLTGTVELRQVTLAFNGSERIEAVLVEEGARVTAGQVLARLETGRLAPQAAQGLANVAGQKAVVDKLRHGNRPEEIAQGRANLDAAKADADNAERQFERQSSLLKTAVTSQQAYDQAKALMDTTKAKVSVQQKALDLLVAGSRAEDVALAEAQLRAGEAQLALLNKQLADADLKSPVDATVRSRLMEPGEMASPTRPVFSLALTDPKWVRAYVSEARLGLVRSGMRARISIDSFPGKPLDGWVGFISPVAEFTPKTVQTEDLRTSLVYEVRVFAKDPENVLRLGMPATVRLLPEEAPVVGADVRK